MNTATAGNDAFTSIGSVAFSGKAGELRWTSAGGQTFVYADTNGDTEADFELTIMASTISATDFSF